MKLSRRNLVLTGLLSPLFGLPRLAAGAEDTAKTLFVVIDGAEKLGSPDLVTQVFKRFFALGIPVAATVKCGLDNSGTNDFLAVLKEFSARESGLLELVVELESSADPERYFQLRNAIDMRDYLSKVENVQSDDLRSAPIVSVINRTTESLLNPYALRAAGFRIQIRPNRVNEAGKTINESQFEGVDWGLAQLEGGIIAPIESNPTAAFSALGRLSGPQAIYLSLENAAELTTDALLTKCGAWADSFQTAMLEDGYFMTRPMDYLLQGNPGASKYIGLVLDMTGVTEDVRLMADFASKLGLAGFPYTVLAKGGTLPDQLTGEKCSALNVRENSDQTIEIVCSSTVADAEADRIAAADILLHKSEDEFFWSGPREDGRYHAVLRTDSVQNFAWMTEADPMTDAILLFDASHVTTPIHQENIIRQFEQARSDGKAHFYSLGEYVEQTLAPDPILKRFWSTDRRQVSSASSPKILTDIEKRNLEDDARLAWQYIEHFSDKDTGLCAGTVQAGAANVINQEITLWDVASQLNGIVAAHSLSIVPTKEAEDRVEMILNNLPSINIDGLSLPPSLFSSDNTGTTRNEFDACDAGRFLIALKRLVDSELTTELRAQSVFEKWDIAATVKGQRPHNFSNGKWEDVTDSHCSHYARNGYFHWGIAMETAYTALTDMESGDQKIRLLYKAAFIGHFGSEPLLLEGLEVGYSPETLYLAEVLFDAQLSWFEDTGQLKCVSEAPLNFAPWFSYQGLRVDRTGLDAWVISTAGHHAQYQTEQFSAKADIISSKAAFMWAAEFPHAYSSRLLELTREKARVEGLGFSVGIFTDSLEPMAGYSDVNTNGIILTAIAKMLAENR